MNQKQLFLHAALSGLNFTPCGRQNFLSNDLHLLGSHSWLLYVHGKWDSAGVINATN